MFKFFLNKFSHCLYIQVWENRIKVTNTDTGTIFDEPPLVAIARKTNRRKVISAIGKNASLVESMGNTKEINPLSHPRTLLSEFDITDKLLRTIFLILNNNSFFMAAPKVLIHPMEKAEGALTQIEKRAFQELVLGAGIYDAIVYLCEELLIKDFNYKTIKAICNQ